MNRYDKSILLTIDVEDWFQVENLRPWFPPESWGNHSLRVVRNTHRLLDLFDGYGTKRIRATFFVLGWVAAKVPELIREIHRRGHEVASHGFGHKMCNQLGSDDLEDDLTHSKHLLEDTIGEQINGYRAPNFSISDHALAIIQSCGYLYDSSYNNFGHHGRYGRISVNGAERVGITIRWDNGFTELPISNLSFGNHVIPWGGGGYFRTFPSAIFRSGIRNILKRDGAYVFYTHPWEFDPDQPVAPEAKGLSKMRHYHNLHKTIDRLDQLIRHFTDCDFITCSEYINPQH